MLNILITGVVPGDSFVLVSQEEKKRWLLGLTSFLDYKGKWYGRETPLLLSATSSPLLGHCIEFIVTAGLHKLLLFS